LPRLINSYNSCSPSIHQQHLTWIIETKNVVLEICASSGNHHLTPQMFAHLVADLTRLQSKLTCRYHN